MWGFLLKWDISGGGRAGANHIVYAIKLCATPKSRDEQSFLPENGCRFCPL